MCRRWPLGTQQLNVVGIQKLESHIYRILSNINMLIKWVIWRVVGFALIFAELKRQNFKNIFIGTLDQTGTTTYRM